MPSSWAVAAAQRILNHLDVEDFPNPVADIIDRSWATGSPYVLCDECGGFFMPDRMCADSAHPEAPAVCDSCFRTTEMVRDLAMEREAHKSALNRNAELRKDTDRVDWLERQDVWIGLEGTYEKRPKIACGASYRLTVRDGIDSGMAQEPLSAIALLREIASHESDDPVLANLIAGIRHGLELADAKAATVSE